MQSTFYQFTVKSLLAGVLIGLGCVIYVASPINYVGSFLFSLGLLTIMVKGLYLYTGKVGDWNVSSTFRLIYMFVLNGMACGATAYLFTLTRIDLHHIHDVVEHKLGDPSMLSSFILAIGCGAMMHIAYSGFNKGKHPLYVIMPVMFFFIFNDYAAGLSYYYFISGLIGILTTWILRKTTNEEKLLAQLEANKKEQKKKPSGLMAKL